MYRFIAMIILLYSCTEINAQEYNFHPLDQRIDSMLTYNNKPSVHLSVVKLIKWDSPILYDFLTIPPVCPPNFSIRVSSTYGYRVHPIKQVSHIHSGIDLPPMSGNDTIYAPANAIVDTIGYNKHLGLFIELSHKYGYRTIYGHLSGILIRPGQSIGRADKIAIMGNTGGSTGKHLHYTIKHNGKSVNPLPYCYILFNIYRSN